jgi:hypothetical protein
MNDEEWNLLEFGRSYSTTKAILRVEVYTTLIKVIYIIFLANVRLLTHPLMSRTEQVGTWNKQQQMAQMWEVSTTNSNWI